MLSYNYSADAKRFETNRNQIFAVHKIVLHTIREASVHDKYITKAVFVGGRIRITWMPSDPRNLENHDFSKLLSSQFRLVFSSIP